MRPCSDSAQKWVSEVRERWCDVDGMEDVVREIIGPVLCLVLWIGMIVYLAWKGINS